MTQDDLLRLIDQAATEGWKTLDLSGQDLTELPSEIGQLTQLETLILGKRKKYWGDFVGNQIKVLPAEIGQLTNLKKLLFEGNRLESLPGEIGQLCQLRILMAGANRLTQLPEGFERLTKLQFLVFDQNKFTSIPIAIDQLHQLKTLHFQSNVLENVSKEISQLTQLRSLDLSFNQLSSLPPEIIQLTQLRSLNLGSNQLSSLPPEIIQLTQLRSLGLNSNGLSSLPPEIGQLTQLRSLNLNSNQVSSLPTEIIQLTQLRSLNLDSNQLSSLPVEIIQLTQLRSLCLNSNQLSSLPPDFIQLTQLRSLSLRSNQLSSLPAEIIQLTQLRSLCLNSNQLSSLPSEIGQLTQLRSLDLSSNQLSSLPAEIIQLTQLRSLDIWNNQFSILPLGICQITTLQNLDISSNQIDHLPRQIGLLTNLKKLIIGDFVGGNQLSNLLPEISQLFNLQSLFIDSNQLSSLPPEILKLQGLESLSLNSNKLISLPPEIAKLQGLKSLSLNSNKLISLPPEIAKLQGLESLSLNSNKLSKLPPEIAKLQGLKSLSLNSNQLSSLPPEIVKLQGLESLSLNSNQLSSLPPEIAKLQGLKSLSLNSNQLSSLLPEIEQLQELKWLDLRGNPIPIPPEILGPKELAQNPGNLTEILDFYFQTIDPNESEPLYEAKFLIVGEGGSGKTTLAKKIDYAEYELQPEEKSTEGIDVIRWDFDHPNGQLFRVNIWDFGGQEIYHATHQFFLTKRSLYAVVVDVRQDNTDLYYWLNVVELLSDNSPVFIIKNEKQDRTCQVNDRQLRSEFNNLKETLRTNLKTNRGLDDIKEKIQQYITHLPHIGTPLPKIWVRVRACLENYSQNCNYIPIEKYYELCEQNQFTDRMQMQRLSTYLHDLGVCLHFHEDDLLKKILILKPEWGTTAVYKALDANEVKENMGRFSRAQLNHIWSAREYADMQGELLQLMVNFKLCYEIPGADNEYIAPQLLDVEQPAYDWDDSNNLLLRYHYDFMPKGIITRFIVDMHRFIEQQKLVWKDGVVLNNGSARAEVIEYYHKGEIHIRVSGTDRRDFLTVVSFKLDEINASYERLKDKYKKLIPCNCSACGDNQKPHFYPREILGQFISDGQLQIQCQRSYEMVDVHSLIDDLNFPLRNLRPGENFIKGIESEINQLQSRANSWPTQTEKIMTIPKIFISYAHEDEQFKDKLDKMMAGMKRRGVIETWQDRLIEPGDDWYESIQTAMNEADIALLLISDDFIESRFINETEVPKLLERRQAEGMRVIPIIVRPCLWASEPLLSKFQALPKNGKPVITFDKENGDRDQAWTDIAKAIEKVSKTFSAT